MNEIDGWFFSEDEVDFIATKGDMEVRASKSCGTRRMNWLMSLSAVPDWVFEELERRKATPTGETP